MSVAQGPLPMSNKLKRLSWTVHFVECDVMHVHMCPQLLSLTLWVQGLLPVSIVRRPLLTSSFLLDISNATKHTLKCARNTRLKLARTGW